MTAINIESLNVLYSWYDNTMVLLYLDNADGSIEVRSIDLVDMVDVIVALFDV